MVSSTVIESVCFIEHLPHSFLWQIHLRLDNSSISKIMKHSAKDIYQSCLFPHTSSWTRDKFRNRKWIEMKKKERRSFWHIKSFIFLNSFRLDRLTQIVLNSLKLANWKKLLSLSNAFLDSKIKKRKAFSCCYATHRTHLLNSIYCLETWPRLQIKFMFSTFGMNIIDTFSQS